MKKNRFWGISKLLMAFALGIVLIIPITFVIPGRPQAEPVQLVENTYVPFAGCPGDRAENYHLAWKIRRPVINMINIAHLRAPDGDTVIPARNRDTFVTGFPTERTINDDDLTETTFTIPDLPPGDYERIIMIATRSGSKPVFVIMPYTVRDDCPQ